MSAHRSTRSLAPGYLWDLNVHTLLRHSFAGDLDVTVRSPLGTVVTLTSDNGAGADNVFNGTTWDDSADPTNVAPFPGDTFAASKLVTDALYTNLVPKTFLVPEEALGAFRGENPNGTWTLSISDDSSGDTGVLDQWSLDVAAIPAGPPRRPWVTRAGRRRRSPPVRPS